MAAFSLCPPLSLQIVTPIGAPPLWSVHLPNALSPNSITRRVGLPHVNWGDAIHSKNQGAEAQSQPRIWSRAGCSPGLQRPWRLWGEGSCLPGCRPTLMQAHSNGASAGAGAAARRGRSLGQGQPSGMQHRPSPQGRPSARRLWWRMWRWPQPPAATQPRASCPGPASGAWDMWGA